MTTYMQCAQRCAMIAFGVSAVIVAESFTPAAAHAQWIRMHHQAYYPADHNWSFQRYYQSADRLFNAFDYGHAILYETLLTRPNAPASLLEEQEYRFITERLLVNPPRLPVVENAIQPQYARLAPEAIAMFEWAHVLHRQLYDVLGDPRMSDIERDSEARRVLDYYLSRPELAFSTKPKSMALMQEQPYSLAFRKGWPRFNGLIWAYHWLQVGLYEPLVVGRDFVERRAMVDAAVARFRQMLVSPPSGLPHQMPMTAAIAPTFAERFPEAAIVFDNLHSMHDVISDILANPQVPRNRKRAEILLAAERFRDDTSFVMTVEGWRTMSLHMGVENQGGRAAGFMAELPQPTVSYGAVMRHDPVTGEMTGVSYGEILEAAAHVHDEPAEDPHAGHQTPAGAAATDASAGPGVHSFEPLPDGGLVAVRADPADTASVRLIREQLRDLREAFSRGDFSSAGFGHDGPVPGTDVMSARSEHIHFMVEHVEGGAVLRMHTSNEAALAAIHSFLWFHLQLRTPGA